MSPASASAYPICAGFPRVSGDEPLTALILRGSQLFSPRERG